MKTRTTLAHLRQFGKLLVTPLFSIVAPRKGKRGRPPGKSSKSKQMTGEAKVKVQRKMDRFNGMSVAEVMAKTLPDILTYNLDILIVSSLGQIM